MIVENEADIVAIVETENLDVQGIIRNSRKLIPTTFALIYFNQS